MNTKRWFFTPRNVAAAVMLILSMCAGFNVRASTNDREYQLGDHTAPPSPNENANNGAAVGSGNAFGTLDSAGLNGLDQLPPLVPKGTTLPVYRTIVGRPDGGGGLGIEFNGSQSQYVHGRSLNWPEESLSAIGGNFPGTINYNGIAGRGMQFWARPTATTAQSLVIDTNQHGVRINANGNFSMRYAERDTDSGVAVTPGTWYHLMVVRPAGSGGGSRMYVNGIAVAADNRTDYSADTADLVIGSNTGGDDTSFTGGTTEFFSGIIDDLTMFVIGDNSADEGPPVGQDWGAFDFATENAFASFKLTGVAGDIDNDNDFDQSDKNGFIAGWMNDNLVNGVRVPDLNSHAAGDLNFDGITNIQDLAIIQALLPAAGLSPITSADLSGVPEPTAAVLLLSAVVMAVAAGRRSRTEINA